MSAYAQNFAYIVGERKPGTSENVMSRDQLEKLCKSAEKYLNKEKNETEKRADK